MSESTVRTRGQRLFGLTLVTYPVMVITAVAGWTWAFAACALLTFALERYVPRWAPAIDGLLTSSHVGWTMRSMVRSMALITLLAIQSATSTWLLVATTLCVVTFEAIQGWFRLITYHVRSRRKLPILTRNVDLSGLHIPDVRYGAFGRMTPEAVRTLFVLPIIGVIVTAITTGSDRADAVPTLIGAAAMTVLTAIGVGRVTIGAVSAGRVSGAEEIITTVQRRINEYEPEVVVYFAGSATSLYQINMWLGVVSQLDRRAMILMRERRNLALLGPTSLPVVCIPSSIDLMSFDLPSVRVALYPANVGKNIHFLRVPGIAHVFIGHGDSDKIASVNPFSKAYDELWVAGPAGRDRWARAAVGVDDKDIVEVGRPQLASIRPASARREPEVFTVLYAPTWEGWTNDPQNTSLTTMGPTIIAALLAHPGNVRVIYKPHPLTGTRDPLAADVNTRIIAMIEQANADRAASEDFANHDEADSRTAAREIARLDTEIDALSISTASTDDAIAARDSGRAHPDYPKEAAALGREWDTIYWASQPEWTHRAVVGSRPALFDCFNNSDVLITDISSVVADFLSSGKPYIVSNSSDLPDGVFRETYPTASAAHLLGPDCDGLTEIVAALAGGDDAWQEERNKLKSYLLGPAEPSPMERFRLAMDNVMIKANAMVRPAPGEDGGEEFENRSGDDD